MQPEKYIPEQVLVIVPHADDIEVSSAGSISKWVQHGAKVTYCIVTDGAAGSNNPDLQGAELVERRKQEQIEAAAKVGVTDICFLGYPDGVLEPTLELRRDLTRLIRQIKPDRVVTFDPTTLIAPEFNYINHPDHVATGVAALYAVFPSAESLPIFPELLAEGLQPHKVKDLYLWLTAQPTTFVDISEHINTKLASLACHSSQINEEFLQTLRKWDSEAGEKSGVGYAELFRVMDFRYPEVEKPAEEAAD